MAVIGTNNQSVSNAPAASDSNQILSGLLPQVRGKSTLIGGTIQSLDHVRDRAMIRAFGGGDVIVLFDARTQVYHDGTAASARDLQAGQRVYVDTALAGTDILPAPSASLRKMRRDK